MVPSTTRHSKLINTLLLFFVASTTWAESVSTFDDIDYWIGQGANHAALVIDWDHASAVDEALVWGYRWDGSATGEDMLLDILESDIRFFAKLSAPGSFGVALYGLGYDHNNDSQFAISDGTTFDADGLAFSGLPDNPPPAAVSTDAADYYAEGWFTGFWNYGISNGNASPFDGGEWVADIGGMANRTLADGDWDSWAFMLLDPNPQPPFTAFAENPHAAEAPLAADFDSDDDIDGADFLAWQRGFGITSGATRSQGDANGDEMVDGVDLNLWQAGFGAMASATAATRAVPEPSAAKLAFLLLFFCFSVSLRKVR